MPFGASINADPMLLPYEYRSEEQLEVTYKNALAALKPLEELPEELKHFASMIAKIEGSCKFATALYIGDKILSVGHICENEALGDRFRVGERLCTLIDREELDGSMGSDCAIFQKDKDDSHAFAEKFSPLAEESILLLVNERGEVLWRNILVDIDSATFSECTMPGYSGAVILSKSYRGWGISGIHIGEKRILQERELLPYLNGSEYKPSAFPHIPGYYEPEGKQNRVPPENIHSAVRPPANMYKHLSSLEKLDSLSDHTLYGSSNSKEADFKKTKYPGRHFADSIERARSIAVAVLSEKGRDRLTVIKIPTDVKKIQESVSKQRTKDPKGTMTKLITTDFETLGFTEAWQFTSFNGEILDETVISVEDYPEVIIKFETGYTTQVDGKKVKKVEQSYMSHIVVNKK